jgi:hypothetical protein
MDQLNTQDTESVWDGEEVNPWNDPVNIIHKQIAHLTRKANVHNDRVTAGGDRDMNAALVESARAVNYMSTAFELQGLAAEVQAAQQAEAEERKRLGAQAANRAYQQGLADGVGQRNDRLREEASALRRMTHGNPSDDRDGEDMIIPKGYIAAWQHQHVAPDGTIISQEVYGVLDTDVRQGDARAVIVSGPDTHVIALDRIRFAPKLHTLVAERDLKKLDALQVLHADGSAVRLVDGMDGTSELNAYVHNLREGEGLEGAQPGTYIRLTINQADNGTRALADISRDQWAQLNQAVEALYARRLIANAEKDES